eukprot:NODE_2141_length_987_cov_261.711373.p2 GENE.NODE_2141_length_987_cov_261.711373~~NODE_2141_length_987_cov_261.711373.p2  ORF type:complete len:301 (-),score=75.97 NODE_2141_length_987_cov_261.711373:69-851(-)
MIAPDLAAPQFEVATQRNLPSMALLTPDQPTNAGIILRKEGIDPLFVPVSGEPGSGVTRHLCSGEAWGAEEVLGEDMGDRAAAWLCKALGEEGLRLVRHTGLRPTPEPKKFGVGTTLFSDGFSLLVVSQASLDEIAERSGIDMITERFRPNIVVEGCETHAEDTWSRILWSHGDARAELVLPKPCSRCTLPRVHPVTGVPGPDPLKELRKYRTGRDLAQNQELHREVHGASPGTVFFGQNAHASVVGSALLRVGDELLVS